MLLSLTRSRSSVASTSARLWLAAALLFSVVAAIGFYHVPTASAAFFEYVGHALVQGKSLYRDVWDNKLPSIYYLNALWQLLFGSQYALHWFAELLVSLATIALFAAFVERERVRLWAPATFAFAVLLSLPPLRHFNYTEPYAVALIMVALVAAQRGAAIVSGIALTLAATFWLPAALQAIAILVLCHRRAAQARFLAGFAGSAAVLVILILSAFGTPAIAAGLQEMYGWQDVHWGFSLFGMEARKAWNTLEATGLLVPFVLALAIVRRPSNERDRFALAWLGTALAGTAISLNFFQHEFLPAVAPLIFAIAAYADRPRLAAGRRVVIAVVAIALVLHAPKMLSAMHVGIAQEMNDARQSVAVGSYLDASLPKDSRILVYGYASGVYLTARRDAAGRFPNHADSGAAPTPSDRAHEREYLAGVREADALVAARPAALFPALDALVRAEFSSACTVEGTAFHVYLRRTLRTAACGSRKSSYLNDRNVGQRP